MATDAFTGSAAALATHDSNWFLADTAAGETLSDMRIDGSGFAVQNNAFGQTRVAYTGTTAGEKSEIVVPIGAFVTVPSSEIAAVVICASAGNKGFEASVGAAQLTGQVVNAVRVASNGAFVVTQTLSPTIDTASVALTMSLQRTSNTNVNLIVNGTTYPINTTGVDIASGQGGFMLHRNSGTATTIKIDSWTNGASSPATLSAATPSGTIGTPTSAILGATSDQATGNFYGVVDTAGNISGITAAQIKSGQNKNSVPAVSSGTGAVASTSPTASLTGLVASTAYSYAVVQNNANGDSNVHTGTFTTAVATSNPDVRKYGAQGFLQTLLTM